MINFICIVLGIYIVVDTVAQASIAPHERRNLVIAKNVAAGMAGIYLVVFSAAGLLKSFDLCTCMNIVGITGWTDDERLLFAITIALHLWDGTARRLLIYCKNKNLTCYPTAEKFLLVTRRSEQ